MQHLPDADSNDAHAPVTVDIDERSLRERVFAERVRQFMVNERLAALSGIVPALYLARLNWNWIRHDLVIGWCLTLWLVDLLTLLHTSRFLWRPPESAVALQRWRWRQVALQTTAGVIWGATVPLFHTPTDGTHAAYNYVVLMAVNSVALIALLPLWVAVVGFSAAIWLLPMIFFLHLGDMLHLQMAAGIVVLLVSLNFYTWSASHDLVQGIERRFRADALAEALRRAVLRIHELATRDELTGVANRREGMHVLEQAFEHHRRRQRDLSVLMVDIDHFKRINDGHGHAVGDLVLQAFCLRVQTTLRKTGTLARIGGEEFMVVLPETAHHEARLVAERVREMLASQPLLDEPVSLVVTASIGLATASGSESMQQCLARADAALYKAKHGGRDRVALAA